ncbi:MAG: hypothetical protein QS748_10055 [Candidatus Endonucleobacter bathymodioli]|uniref:Uncharacterized protein n=1 Tax=Candidatus Endonucleibacter bathymodioli TaxID=539814 RepID=A0AA90STG5_9GAMM|nr:hypothetical protein [Candidatus Endonucleobacter bathymodioli]
MKFLLCFPIVMTISIAFSQDMYLSSNFFDNNTAVIVPYKWRTTKNEEGEPITYKNPTIDPQCAFSFETHSINTSDGGTNHVNKFDGYNSLLNWANAPSLGSVKSTLEDIQNLLNEHNNNPVNIHAQISFEHENTNKYYTLTSHARNDLPLIRQINREAPSLNRWLDFRNDPNLSSYLFCVDHSNRIRVAINEIQKADTEGDSHDISVHVALYKDNPVAIALLETYEDKCHIQHMVTNPYAQLCQMKHRDVQGADEALLHSIIRMFQKEGIIKHVKSTSHSYKDEDLRNKGWILNNTEKPKDSRSDNEPTYEVKSLNNIGQPTYSRSDIGTTNEVKSLNNTEQPEYSRRKKHKAFCCFRK